MAYLETKQYTKYLWVVFLTLTAISVAVSFYRFYILRDYEITAQVTCDPAQEKCFIQECDPEVEVCTGDTAKDTTYYKLIHRLAQHIPLCDPNDADCHPLQCAPSEANCFETLCDEITASEEGVACSDPATFKAYTGETEANSNAGETLP